MCGIIGWFGINKRQDIRILVQKLQVLLNRGYDSVGVGYINEDQIFLSKFVTENITWIQIFDKLNKELNLTNCMVNNVMMHTRWATHGNVTDNNAHPHISINKKIILVHNGIIENYNTLIQQINITPLSETDSCLIADMISLSNETNFVAQVKETIEVLKGTFALIIMSIDFPDEMILVRKDSPLILGKSKNGNIMIVSEKSAFLDDIIEIYTLKNNDIISLKRINNDIIIKNESIGTLSFVSLDKSDPYYSIVTSPYPYPYWIISEIYQQADKIKECNNYINNNTIYIDELLNNIQKLNNIKRIIFFGCGTSHNANLVVKEFIEHNFFTYLDKYEIDIYAYDASGFPTSKIRHITNGNTLFIMSSQSGETIDLYQVICKLKQRFCSKNITYLGVINVPDSLITNYVDICVYLKVGKEHSVASTKSYTNMVLSNILIISYLLQYYENNFDFLQNQIIRPLINLNIIVEEFIPIADKFVLQKVIPIIKNINNIFIIGNRMDYYVAMESSLKIKEVSYIHAEASLGGSLKHGPFALLSPEILVIIIITIPSEFVKLYNVYKEIKSRNTNIIILTTVPFKVDNNEPVLHIPFTSYSFLMANIVSQLIAYHIAINRNINPDFPRNLAKVVTVP